MEHGKKINDMTLYLEVEWQKQKLLVSEADRMPIV
jgi:hypothetical protein